ncbi:MAG: orotidine-5'-phosphate decarboxylase [Proteobacteria bacterium]|nr:orotidine-5'-phosphate decarboxylase [Pseudomonadota bacterium]
MLREYSQVKENLNENAKKRLIFALDIGEDIDGVLKWAGLLKDHVGMFKVGKEAFTSYGPEIVSRIRKMGGKVFLDLKFHDIPNTVCRAAESAVKLGVSMFNIHALGGKKMMEETVTSIKKMAEQSGASMPVILAVTVLTSLGDDDLEMLGFNGTTEEIVLNLARTARDAGVSGVVASARDVTSIREACGEDFIIVTPGIRGGMKIAGDDQKRTLTPKEAIKMGADFIVVGRPIIMADDPARAADEICKEISEGLDNRRKAKG